MEGFRVTISSFLLIFAVVNVSNCMVPFQVTERENVEFDNLEDSVGPKYGSGSDSNDGASSGAHTHSGSVKNYSMKSKDGSTQVKISVQTDWDNTTLATPTSTQGSQSTATAKTTKATTTETMPTTEQKVSTTTSPHSTTVPNNNGTETATTITTTTGASTSTAGTSTSTTTEQTTTIKKKENGFNTTPSTQVSKPSQIFNTTEPSNQNGTDPNSAPETRASILSFILASIILHFVSHQ